MTREEFVEKYGDVTVKFSSYYKFTFTFSGVLANGDRIMVDVGGNSDDIYRMEVSADSEEAIAKLDAYSGSVWHKGKEVESFYDY